MVGIDEGKLDDRLAALEQARAWSPRVVSKLEALLRSDDEEDLFRVDPIRFASERNIDEGESIDLFLHAAKQGLFRMEWQLVCPECTDLIESFASVAQVKQRYFCHLCRVDVEVALDQYIQVGFTVSPAVRKIGLHTPEELPVEDYCLKYHFNTGVRCGGVPLNEAMRPLIRVMHYVGAGERWSHELELTPGLLRVLDLSNRATLSMPVGPAQKADGPNPREVHVRLTAGEVQGPSAPLSAGPAKLVLENASERRAAVMVPLFPAGAAPPPMEHPKTLDGKRLFVTRTYRELYGEQTVGDDGLALRDITLLFSDLKGSTDLYDRIGDIKAFHLVQDHFGRLADAIGRHGGVIVKTIGDAVMATFDTPTNAVAAVLDMTRALERVNSDRGQRDLVLKLGIHRGPSIAVTLNGRLDYFGQAVNIAARVQGLAEADEVCLTAEVANDDAVRELLAKHGLAGGTDLEAVDLKGVTRPVRVARVRLRPSQPGG